MSTIDQEHKNRIESQVELLKALANPVRLCLLEKLIEEGETSVTDITSCMDVTQAKRHGHCRMP